MIEKGLDNVLDDVLLRPGDIMKKYHMCTALCLVSQVVSPAVCAANASRSREANFSTIFARPPDLYDMVNPICSNLNKIDNFCPN